MLPMSLQEPPQGPARYVRRHSALGAKGVYMRTDERERANAKNAMVIEEAQGIDCS